MRLVGGLAATAVTAAVAMIAIMGGCGGGKPAPSTPTTTAATQTTQTTPTTAPLHTIELPFRQMKDADGARGAVRLSADGHKRLKLTITVSGAHRRYVVSLWTTRDKAHGLYAGYPGTNTQELRLLARTLVHYRWLNVVEQIPKVRRDRHVQIHYRDLLRVPTNELLNKLLVR